MPAAQTGLLVPNDPPVVERGRSVYDANCAQCHGVSLEGQPNWKSPDKEGLMPGPPHDETGHTWHHSDDILFGITKVGVAKFTGLKDYKSAMPAYENILSDEEIFAALSYIKSQWSEDVRRRHDTMNKSNE
jgi:mono/diheme cytochrome c family protein